MTFQSLCYVHRSEGQPGYLESGVLLGLYAFYVCLVLVIMRITDLYSQITPPPPPLPPPLESLLDSNDDATNYKSRLLSESVISTANRHADDAYYDL